MSDISADPGLSGRLVSGEAVELDVRVARLGSRVLAFGIDFTISVIAAAIFYVVSMLLLYTLAASTSLVDEALLVAIITIDMVLAFVGVPATIETLSKGRSLGKLAVGLRVVRDDGGPIRFRHALIRALSAFAVEFPGLLLPGISWFAALGVMLIHPSGKRFGDLSAGTIVIHERTPHARIWVPIMPPGLAGWAAVTDLTALDDNLALSIRHFLARNHEIAEPARTKLGLALAAELNSFVVPPPPPGTPGWAFLAAVLSERYRRASSRLAASRAVTAQVWDTLYGPHQGQAMWTHAPPPVWTAPPTTLPQVPAAPAHPATPGAW
ncbi:RDD family protein [Stackebrandtia nassauensis]|uniref:RDD domain containing protein n=1 Tax=Stackebrandtia nassauensis (strain DSM 44728 / CIP 108903 / NRRL B-16338 / NBRC 102104 / LLR-40K-21) TaxID=446470 RepID=D3PWG0_STANL|nr:RDD family protein [Stackebrandtia nassauensis]ADD41317.1 RDD domain containing protein [Stackebrandtia nassauensis DSM 44728]